LYQNILIPTDRSDLAAGAVEHGVGFAKEVCAKVTEVTVTEPFAVFAWRRASSNIRGTNTRGTRTPMPRKP